MHVAREGRGARLLHSSESEAIHSLAVDAKEPASNGWRPHSALSSRGHKTPARTLNHRHSQVRPEPCRPDTVRARGYALRITKAPSLHATLRSSLQF